MDVWVGILDWDEEQWTLDIGNQACAVEEGRLIVQWIILSQFIPVY